MYVHFDCLAYTAVHNPNSIPLLHLQPSNPQLALLPKHKSALIPSSVEVLTCPCLNVHLSLAAAAASSALQIKESHTIHV